MKRIDSQEVFEAMLRAERAVALVVHSNSARAEDSQAIVERWERVLTMSPQSPAIEAYILFADDHPYTWKWLNKVNDCPDGKTEDYILFTRKGLPVGKLPAKGGRENALSRMLLRCFGGEELVSGLRDLALKDEEHIFDTEFLQILRCPETQQKLHMAAAPVLENLNNQIALGCLKNRGGHLVRNKIDGGLIRADGQYLYPLQANIPVMLMDEAILLNA